MFVNDDLKQHLETSSSINSQALVVAEWNMNVAENISTIGNYRYRPTSNPEDSDFVYKNIIGTFDINDSSNTVKFYTGATNADIVVDGGLNDNNQPIAFTQPNEKERLLYSLEDCFRRFRPRSGINKLRYFEDGYTHFVNNDLARRPRYYMASRNDSFKYWTSYRTEQGYERGIANKVVGALNYIDDAAPFVVYKEQVPANRIVVKMQTQVGEIDLGTFSSGFSSFSDPFYGDENKATPLIWKIQVLKNNVWQDIISFNQLSVREDGSAIIGPDGYVEVGYGLILPTEYKNKIHFAGKYPFASLLPVSPAINSAYFVQENDNELGMIYVWNGEEYESFIPQYGWEIISEEVSEQSNFVKEFVNPEYFVKDSDNQKQYKEFEYLQGIRVVVQTMNKINSTFDLIELSPRLTCDITDRVASIRFNKSASDLGVSGMPVGQLLASNGNIDIFDFDDSFNKNNTNSILSSFTSNNLQIKLFDIIYKIDSQVESFHVPLKILYADGFPQSSSNTRKFSLNLRDMFFYFETLNAPQLLVENASLSYAVSFLLDSIGFSNYSFKRVEGEEDPIIPYFFVEPDTSVANVLQDLAIATQTAMFFDEYNNFIMMSKRYIMPSEDERATDAEILGSLDQTKDKVVENKGTGTKLANIVELSSKNQEVFNDGRINFAEKYIAKTYGSLKQASYINQDQNWIYEPTLLWQVAGTEKIRSLANEQADYALSAIPLNSDLSDVLPYVENNELQNNIIDFAEGAYWVSKYAGYFYANGEIIKYDAVEYNVSGIGNVWISSVREYQNYFSKIQFGGKIYPTGRVRIYAEPFYIQNGDIVVMQNGPVRKHGRMQFGTGVIKSDGSMAPAHHSAGLPSYWSDTTPSAPVQGVEMDSRYLFSSFPDRELTGVYNQKSIDIEVSIDITDVSNINDMVFAESKWLAVGNDAGFRTSSDGETWVSYVENAIDDSFVFLSVDYGAGRWVAAGYKQVGEYNVAAMAYSDNAVDESPSWTEVTGLLLESDAIHKVVYKNSLWLAVGNNGLILTSSNGTSWTQRTQKLDYTVVGTNKPKILSKTERETNLKIDKFQVASPGIVVAKSHTLQNNDKIKFITTSGSSLPTGLDTTTEYPVRYVNKDSFHVINPSTNVLINFTNTGTGTNRYQKIASTFTVKGHEFVNGEKVRVIANGSLPSNVTENTAYSVRVVDKDKIHLAKINPKTFTVTIASPAVFTSTNHQLENDERILLSTTGALPTGLSVDTIYYVIKINDNTFRVASEPGGTPINTSGSQSGTHSYTLFYSNKLGDLVSYVADQSNSSHKVERFIGKNLYSIEYADSKWAVGGQSGVFSTSTDAITWVASETGMKKADILNIIYGSSQWVLAGTSGKLQRSTNLTSWTGQDTKVNKSIRALAFGGGTWIAAGEDGKLSISSNLTKWTSKDPKFENKNINRLEYKSDAPSHWLAVGDGMHVSKSTDNGEKWTDTSQENVGELFFTSSIPHGLTPFDTIKIQSTGQLSDNPPQTVTAVETTNLQTFTVTVASPAVFTKNNHGLNTNDKVILSTTNTLPTGLEIAKIYFVKKLTNNTFELSETRGGTSVNVTGAGTGTHSYAKDGSLFTSNNHKLKENSKIRFSISAGGQLPVGIDATSLYYVVPMPDNASDADKKNKFRVTDEVNGTAIVVSGIFSGTLTYTLNPISPTGTYFVTPKNITDYTFTVADTRSDARNGATFAGRGYQFGEHKVRLETLATPITVTGLEEESYTPSSGSPYNTIKLLVPDTSKLGEGDRIFLSVTSSAGSYISKKMSYGIVRYAPYYIVDVEANSYIIVSENYSGNPVKSNGIVSSLAAGEYISIIPNITEEIAKTTLLSSSTINFEVGNLLEVTEGNGQLTSPTRVSAIRQKTEIKKTIEEITIANPAVIKSTGHGLFDMDTITFLTTDTLPAGIDTNLQYYVNRIDDNYFNIYDYYSFELIETFSPDEKDPDKTIDLDALAAAEALTGDAKTQALNKIYNYREGKGTHSFVKSFNDSNRLILDRQVGTELPQYSVTTEEVLVDIEENTTQTVNYYQDISYENSIIATAELQVTNSGKAGFSTANKELARSATRNGIIKNFFAKSSFSETDVNKFLSTRAGTIQSSAFVFGGPSFEFPVDAKVTQPIDFVSYIHKPLENKFSHFGTRMRIIGRIGQEEAQQIIYNGLNYFLNPEHSLDEQFSIYGGSAGLAIMVNPETNVGYYFELIALSQSNIAEYSDDVGLFNVVFYKVVRKIANEGEATIDDDDKAIPIKLWQGVTSIVADDGTLVGQFRMVNEENPSVYDVSIEYEELDNNTRKFYLLINNKVIAVVDDKDPLPVYNNMALFVRGSTKAMFENIYAVANNYTQNTVFELDAPVNSIFSNESIDISQAFRKYALSGAVQSTYLSGIGTGDSSKYKIYFEEFGTIMRECAYFNIRYDKAYPALYAKFSEPYSKMKGYTISGFVPSAYGAEFLVFNNTDTALDLSGNSGNYLTILGVTFKQSTERELTVDDYFERVSNFSDPEISTSGTIISPKKAKEDYLDIKNSRITYGRKEFNIASPYIQSQDEANNLMGWMISKIMKPRKSVGIKLFGMPTIQLGDIVTIDYESNDSIEQISLNDSRFVVYNIEYSRDKNGPAMNVFLSEVL